MSPLGRYSTMYVTTRALEYNVCHHEGATVHSMSPLGRYSTMYVTTRALEYNVCHHEGATVQCLSPHDLLYNACHHTVYSVHTPRHSTIAVQLNRSSSLIFSNPTSQSTELSKTIDLQNYAVDLCKSSILSFFV